MIEKILKTSIKAFMYGKIAAVNEKEEKVQVDIGSKGMRWIKTAISLEKDDVIIVARNIDSSLFVVQGCREAVPHEKILMEV